MIGELEGYYTYSYFFTEDHYKQSLTALREKCTTEIIFLKDYPYQNDLRIYIVALRLSKNIDLAVLCETGISVCLEENIGHLYSKIDAAANCLREQEYKDAMLTFKSDLINHLRVAKIDHIIKE